MTRAKKPIRIFWSTLSNRFYASRQYREDKRHPGNVVIAGDKYDVTNEIAYAIEKYGIVFRKVKS